MNKKMFENPRLIREIFDNPKSVKEIFDSPELVIEVGTVLTRLAKEIIDSNDMKEISDFRDLLSEFIDIVRKSKVFRQIDRLEIARKFELKSMYDLLRQLELEFAKHFLDLQRDNATLRDMEEIAFPTDTNMAPRNYSKWSNWSAGYSERTKSKLATARLPE